MNKHIIYSYKINNKPSCYRWWLREMIKMEEKKYCSTCGQELTEAEIETGQEICTNCELSIVHNDNLYPNLDGEF